MKFKTEIFSSSHSLGPAMLVSSIDEALNLAVDFGINAIKCIVYDSNDLPVAIFSRLPYPPFTFVDSDF